MLTLEELKKDIELINEIEWEMTPEEAVNYGAAHGALAMTTPGDTTMVTLEQVKACAEGGSARVQR